MQDHMSDGDARALLRDLADPDRYLRFLDSPDEPDEPDEPPGARATDSGVGRRDLGGVAARLAAALTSESDGAAGGAGTRENPADDGTDDAADGDGADGTDAEGDGDGDADDERADGDGADGGAADGAADAGPRAEPARQDGPVEAPQPVAARTAPHHRSGHPVLRAPLSAMRTPTGDPDPARVAHYLTHSADLTLNGGLDTALTAGPAVCALAEQYALRRVGGSSAAAVTAAAAAAAELGRTAPEPATSDDPGSVRPGFAGLAATLGWLAGHDEGAPPWRLARMFAPDAAGRDLHRLLVAAVRPRERRWHRRSVRLAAAALATLDRAGHVVLGLLWFGALVGCAGVIVAIARSPYVADVLVPFAAVPLAVTFALAAAAASALLVAHGVRGAVRDALEGDGDRDGFGVVPGIGPAGRETSEGPEGPEAPQDGPPSGRLDRLAGLLPPAGTPALFDWITDRLDDLAAVRVTTHGAQRYALTFGELWSGRMGGRSAADLKQLRRAASDPRRRVVDLVLVAADLSAGRPRLLPFGVADRPEQVTGGAFLFCRTCLVALMPARVVDQMVLMSPGSDTSARCPRHSGEPLHALPDPWDLPVAFAVRLAAATPGLLRPVPLHAADPTQPSGGVRTHWFADGALVGGLPNAAFDAPLPRWPTFSVGAGAYRPPGDDDVELPGQDARPHDGRWRPVSGPGGLVAALLGTVVGWRDGLQAEAPGRRGRLAAVRGSGRTAPFLDGEEIGRLAVLGHRAGQVLRERFTAEDGAEGHTRTDRFRWVRLRAALSEYRQLSLSIGASIPLYTDLALGYRVPADLSDWFSPPLAAGHADPAWGDAVAAVTHLRSLADGGVLDWDTDWGAPPSDPHQRLA